MLKGSISGLAGVDVSIGASRAIGWKSCHGGPIRPGLGSWSGSGEGNLEHLGRKLQARQTTPNLTFIVAPGNHMGVCPKRSLASLSRDRALQTTVKTGFKFSQVRPGGRSIVWPLKVWLGANRKVYCEGFSLSLTRVARPIDFGVTEAGPCQSP